MLQDQDLAFINNRLQVPLIMGDILNDRASLNGDVQYGLHEAISDLQPDSALLCIALSAQTIFAAFKNISPSTRVLEMECQRIIHDYGQAWVQNARGQQVNIDDLYEVLIHTADDLDSLCLQLEINFAFLARHSDDAAALCKILHLQASAQAMIAETFMSVAEEATFDKAKEESNSSAVPSAAFSSAATTDTLDNIIPFPTAGMESQMTH